MLKLSGLVEPDDDEPRDVGIGDSLYFISSSAFGGAPPRIAVVCEYIDGEGMRQTARNELTLP